MKDILKKDNKLIESKYSLTKTQLRFFAFMVNKIDYNDIDFFDYESPLKDIYQILDIKHNNKKELIYSLRELTSKNIVLKDNKDEFEMCNLLSYVRVKDGYLTYRFDKSLKPYLLELKENFTQLSLKIIFSFNSSYSIRFYEILEMKVKQYQKYNNEDILKFDYELQELKEMLAGEIDKKENIIIPKSYNRFTNFHEKVIKVAYKELKEKAQFYFEYELIKVGKKVKSVIFIIKFKDNINIKDNIKIDEKVINENEYDRIDSLIDYDYLFIHYQTKDINSKRQIMIKANDFIKYCVEKDKKYKDYTISFMRYIEIGNNNNWNF